MAVQPTMSQGGALKEYATRTLKYAFERRGVKDIETDERFKQGLKDVETIGNQITGDLDVTETNYIRLHYQEAGFQKDFYRRVGVDQGTDAWTSQIFDDGGTFAPLTQAQKMELVTMPNTRVVNAALLAHDDVCTFVAYQTTWRLGARIASSKGSIGMSIATTQARSNALMLLAACVIYTRTDAETLKGQDAADFKTPKEVDFGNNPAELVSDQKLRYPVLLEKWAVELLAHWGLAVTLDGVTARVGVVPDGDTDSRATAANRKALHKFVKTKQAGTTLGIMGMTLKAWETLDPQGWESKSALGSYVIAFATQPSHKSKLFPDAEKKDGIFLEAMGASDLVATRGYPKAINGKVNYVVWTVDEWSAWRKESDRIWKARLDDAQQDYEDANGADSLVAA